jgi:membrane associated rhomboid family serine protease
MFLHGSWLHLLGNMLFLLIFGNNIEDRMGHIRFALFYAACGYAAAYGFAIANSNSGAPLIGASGAIAGVLGAYLVLFPKVRVWVLVPFLIFLPLRLPAWLVLGFWFVLQAVYSSGEGVSDAGTVAYAAHIVGFLAGMLLAWPLRPGTPPPPEPRSLLFGRRARPNWHRRALLRRRQADRLHPTIGGIHLCDRLPRSSDPQGHSRTDPPLYAQTTWGV